MLLAPRSRRRTNRLPRPDGRRPEVKRFHQLRGEFTADIGERLSSIDSALLDQAAGLIVQAELLQARVIAGQDASASEAIRLASESRRILTDLKAKSTKNGPDRPLTIREKLLLEGSA